MKPKYVWILHNNCSGSCPHCFCNPLSKDDASETEELAAQLTRQGMDYRIYATDQMDPKLSNFYDKINQHECLIAGHEADTEMIGKRPDVERIAFSIHGPDVATHELLAPKDSFEGALKGIREITSNGDGREVEVYSVIHGRNYSFLQDMCRLMSDLGAVKLAFVKLAYQGRAVNLDDDFFLKSDQVAEFLQIYHEIKHDFAPMRIALIDNWGPQYSKFRQLVLRLYGRFFSRNFCKCGSENVTIKSDTKEVYPCKFAVTTKELKMGHFDPEKGLVMTENWFDRLHENIEEPCRSCPVFRACGGGCRGEAIAEKLRRTGAADPFAGFVNCPVSLGVMKWFDPRNDARSAMNIVSALFSKGR